MKSALLIGFLCLNFLHVKAQDAPVNSLPTGKYESQLKSGSGKWEKGDLLLLSENRYKLSSGAETGEYRFSAAAQKVFFTSGPMKGAVAKTSLQLNQPSISIPVAENKSIGLSFAPSDLVAVLKN